MKKNLTTLLLVIAAVITPIGTWAQQANITGLTITVDGTVYGVGQTAIVTPQTTSLIFTLTGENFANLTENHNIDWKPGLSNPLLSGWWDIDTENNTATLDNSRFLPNLRSLTTPYEPTYTNDGSNWIKSGVKIVYDNGMSEEEKAVITSLTVTVDGTVYGAGQTAIITPQTTSIIFTVYGENFANLTHHTVRTTPRGSTALLSGWWIIDTENNSATMDLSDRLAEYQVTTPFEVRYSNNGQQTWIYSGVFVIYDDGTTTALGERPAASSENKKVLRHGQVVIIRDGVEYDMMGQRLR